MTKALLIFTLITTFNSILALKYGLKSKDDQPLKLLELKTLALVEGPYAEIKYLQTYQNPYDKPLETEFYFPRTDSSVFHKFEAIFRNQTIVGHIFEKQKAKEMYECNVEMGNTVAYSERNALVPDVMQILVGNIPPHESVEIIFSMIQPLEVVVNKFWGFTLPSVLTERYTPSTVDSSQTPHITNVENVEDSLYKDWRVSVEIKSDTPFEYLANPSHHLQPKLTEVTGSSSDSKIYKALWDVTIVPNKDFIIYFRSDNLQVPNSILATHPVYPNDHVLLVNFIPELNYLDLVTAQNKLQRDTEGLIELQNLVLDEDTRNAKAEFIFVIDRSGSMQGLRIQNLRAALIKFFQILPKDSYFNIVNFGSSFSLYKLESVKSTPESLKEVMEWISSIQADMGGTEILTAIQKASSLQPIQGYPRTIMLLTDGNIYNPDDVIRHALTHSNQMRFCTVGIGYGSSEYLVKNTAKAGKCTSVFVRDGEDIGDKAMYIVKSAVSRYLDDINFEVECFDKNHQQIYHREEKGGMLLKDAAFRRWIYLQNISSNIQSCKVKIEYYNSLKEKHIKEELEIQGFQTAEITDVWHKIAYDSMIKELDLETKTGHKYGEEMNRIENIKSKIVDLSVKYQVLSDYTSFLAVIQENQQDSTAERVKKLIPNMNSADYNTLSSSQGMAQESLKTFGRGSGAVPLAAPHFVAGSASPMLASNSTQSFTLDENEKVGNERTDGNSLEFTQQPGSSSFGAVILFILGFSLCFILAFRHIKRSRSSSYMNLSQDSWI